MRHRQDSFESSDELSRKVAHAMLRAVQKNYGRLISEARKQWERKFAGSDPSDACVTVRISGAESPDLARMFPLKPRQILEPFATN